MYQMSPKSDVHHEYTASLANSFQRSYDIPPSPKSGYMGQDSNPLVELSPRHTSRLETTVNNNPPQLSSAHDLSKNLLERAGFQY
ncbi:hypothetical protein HOI26_02800 [Candidatus Woesearchaeota archaeon]|jgi:hypothetical protein|nr:hypothetical protein [Candidatus Woesearchaeota archaeon]MBT5740007.1 hypothetical protein [Candidatus Woesearchaeota archaeon]